MLLKYVDGFRKFDNNKIIFLGFYEAIVLSALKQFHDQEICKNKIIYGGTFANLAEVVDRRNG